MPSILQHFGLNKPLNVLAHLVSGHAQVWTCLNLAIFPLSGNFASDLRHATWEKNCFPLRTNESSPCSSIHASAELCPKNLSSCVPIFNFLLWLHIFSFFEIMLYCNFLNPFITICKCLIPSNLFPREVCIGYHGFSFFPMNLISALYLIRGVVLVYPLPLLLN